MRTHGAGLLRVRKYRPVCVFIERTTSERTFMMSLKMVSALKRPKRGQLECTFTSVKITKTKFSGLLPALAFTSFFFGPSYVYVLSSLLFGIYCYPSSLSYSVCFEDDASMGENVAIVHLSCRFSCLVLGLLVTSILSTKSDWIYCAWVISLLFFWFFFSFSTSFYCSFPWWWWLEMLGGSE